MRSPHRLIRGCLPPMEVAEADHFGREWWAPIAQAVRKPFGPAR